MDRSIWHSLITYHAGKTAVTINVGHIETITGLVTYRPLSVARSITGSTVTRCT